MFKTIFCKHLDTIQIQLVQNNINNFENNSKSNNKYNTINNI